VHPIPCLVKTQTLIPLKKIQAVNLFPENKAKVLKRIHMTMVIYPKVRRFLKKSLNDYAYNLPEEPATDADARDGPSEAASGGDETGDPNSAQQPALKNQTQPEGNIPDKEHQGSKKPQQEPEKGDIKSQMPHTDEEREKMMEKGEFPRDPNDHSGEPLHMHGEGGQKAEDDAEIKKEDTKTDRSKSVAHEGGDPHEGPKKGTGQEYVKSSGLAADGGDFDASKPGAGAEADRK
jgi:hypothetical protein